MKTILVLTDFSKTADRAAGYAYFLANFFPAKLIVFNSFTGSDAATTLGSSENGDPSSGKNSMLRLRELRTRLKSNRAETRNRQPVISCRCQQSHNESLGSAVSRFLAKEAVWMIVMGAKSDDCLSNFIFGTNGYSVLSHANCPVMFVPPYVSMASITNVLVVSSCKQRNSDLLYLDDFKKAFDCEITLVRANFEARDVRPPETHSLNSGNVAATLFGEAASRPVNRRLPDLIGVITKKEALFEHLFHSNVTRLLVDNTSVPLLAFPFGT